MSTKANEANVKAVSKWMRTTKARMVAAFGGECCICGYDRSTRALCFHHLDPADKKFSIAEARACARSWKKIVAELRKCVLICQNCHMELEDGLVRIPLCAVRFDECFATYTNTQGRVIGK